MPASKPEFIVRHEVLIHAPAETIFDFLSEPEKLSLWFGGNSSLDARKGGDVRITFPNGLPAVGNVLEIERPRRILFTWGYPPAAPRESSPVLPGSSTIEITLTPQAGGTLVKLIHKLPTESAAKEHVGGWAYHMARLGTNAARAHFAKPAFAAVEHWFAAWSVEGEECEKHLKAAVVDDVVFRDDAATAFNRSELQDHIFRCHKFMKGVKLLRKSPVYQCADLAVCNASMAHGDKEFGPSRLVFSLAQDGRIRQATGFFEGAVPGVTTGTSIGG